MGLAEDIKNAMIESMGDDNEKPELNELQKKQLTKQSELMSKAIIDFLQKQEFTVTQLKASVELESLTTKKALNQKVKTDVRAITGTPSAGGGIVPGTGTAVNQIGKIIDSLNLSNNGGQGGKMSGKGYAWIGKNKPPSGETEQGKNDDNVTVVKLLKIKKDSE
jgi:hypothetical protein